MKEDRKRANEARAAGTRIIQATPDDDDPPISGFEEWIEPDSTASLQRRAGDLRLKALACEFASLIWANILLVSGQ
jgi:hypothetical protein